MENYYFEDCLEDMTLPKTEMMEFIPGNDMVSSHGELLQELNQEFEERFIDSLNDSAPDLVAIQMEKDSKKFAVA